MLLYALTLAATVPSVADMRVQGVGVAWERCVRLYTAEFESAQREPGSKFEFTREMAVDSGIARCASFENDYRNALVIYAPEYLKNTGVTSYTPDVVNMLAAKTLKIFEQKMSALIIGELPQARLTK